MTAAAKRDQRVNRHIGKYEIMGTLGRGSMGIVYKARDPEIGRIVAIKTLRTIESNQFHSADAAVERFKREARSAGSLRHPNIITVFEVGRDGDVPYLVMDFVEGESLESHIAARGRLDPRVVIPYAMQIASGLDHAHARGVVHRDIKPSNILIDRNGVVFILDFGVATITESFADVDGGAHAGPIIGTPGYMSPEQILNHPLDHRTDLFSFAAVIFESLSGKRPFAGETFNEVISNILASNRLSIVQLVPGYPLAIEAEFEKALAHSREDRFQNARSMVEAIAVALNLSTLPTSDAANPFNLPDVPRKRKSSGWRSFRPRENGHKSEEEGRSSAALPQQDGSAFNPWDLNNRKINFQPDSPVSEAKIRRTPGEMFAHYEGFHRNPIQASPAPSDSAAMRRLTIMFSGICVALGSILLLLLFGEATPSSARAPLPETEVRIGVSEGATGGVLHAPARPVSPHAIPLPEVEPAPDGVSIAEMSDAQIEAVLMSTATSEWDMLMAIKEAQSRRVAHFVEASQVALQHQSYQVRIAAIKALAERGDRRAVAPLLLRLDDQEPLVRGNAARALGQLGDRGAVGYLTARMAIEDDSIVKIALKKAIERITGVPYAG